MKLFASMVTLCLAVALISGTTTAIRRRRDRKILNRYLFEGDEAGLLSWLRAKQTAARLLWVMETLLDREAHEKALTVYHAFPFDAYPDRHIRFFASRLFAKVGDWSSARILAERLYAERPNDDAVLDLLIDALIGAGAFAEARDRLLPRLQRKIEGTIFQRHYVRLLVHEGKDEQAEQILAQLVQREFTLFSNTIAQPAKSLIGKQYEESRALLQEIRQRLGRAEELS